MPASPHRLRQRRAIRGALLVLSVAAATACGGDRAATGSDAWRVGVVTPRGGEGALALRGAQLAAEEAERAGQLMGARLELLTARAESPEQAVRAARSLRRRGAVAVVGGFDEPSCRALSEWAAREQAVFVNVGCASDALRGAEARHTLHVAVSDAMRRAALERAGNGDSTLVVVPWHQGLTRYGAAQLNERFQRRFGAAASGAQWTSWMAVKAVWEALLRTRSAEPGALLAFLRGQNAQFDGHKGEPLRFDPRTHQLHQPLYLVDAAGVPVGQTGGGAQRRPDLPAGVKLSGGPYVLVSNERSGDVAVLDPTTHRLVALIPVGQRPRGIQASPDGRRVYVALSDEAPTAESAADVIVAIDLARGEVTDRHPAGTDPEAFGLSPDGRLLYASNEDAGTASITDLRTGRVLTSLAVGIEPEGVAVSPDGRWVYVTAETSNTVSVIDTRTREVAASFLVDVRPRAAAFAPDGARAYVTNEISGTVSVVDAREHRVVATVALPDRRAKPVGVVVSPDGSRVYVANGHAHSVSVIDARSLRVVATAPVGRRPWGIALSPDGRTLYTANGGSDDVSVLDASTLQLLATVPVGDGPWGVTVSPRRR